MSTKNMKTKKLDVYNKEEENGETVNMGVRKVGRLDKQPYSVKSP